MTSLDDIDAIKKMDRENVYGSVEELYKQCPHAWEDANKIDVPDEYKNIDKILMTGMGGSGLGARIIESVYGPTLKYPLIRLNDYNLPDWVNEKTLVICSSFSGTTEEAVENARQAKEKKSRWMAIGTGDPLIDLAKESGVPFYQIIPTYNPSKQPRMAIGYSVVGQLVMAAKAGVIALTKEEIQRLTEAMQKVVEKMRITVPESGNVAKQTAIKLFNKKVIFVASRHLMGAAHTFKNQMNENAKNFSALFDIPELNHHLMEGLRFPESNKRDLVFLFADSDLYPGRIRQRIEITKEVIAKNNISVVSWKPAADDVLAQVFEFVQFGGYVNFYLAMLNGLDPAAIPWVDYFKTKLGQSLGQWK